MKIVISAQGTETASPVDPRFGRAKFFVLYDTETDISETCSNQVNLNAAQGAGIQAAKTVADLGANVLLTGNVGPKAYTALSAACIDVYTGVSGTVADALAAYNVGSLQRADQASVEGHW